MKTSFLFSRLILSLTVLFLASCTNHQSETPLTPAGETNSPTPPTPEKPTRVESADLQFVRSGDSVSDKHKNFLNLEVTSEEPSVVVQYQFHSKTHRLFSLLQDRHSFVCTGDGSLPTRHVSLRKVGSSDAALEIPLNTVVEIEPQTQYSVDMSYEKHSCPALKISHQFLAWTGPYADPEHLPTVAHVCRTNNGDYLRMFLTSSETLVLSSSANKEPLLSQTSFCGEKVPAENVKCQRNDSGASYFADCETQVDSHLFRSSLSLDLDQRTGHISCFKNEVETKVTLSKCTTLVLPKP